MNLTPHLVVVDVETSGLDPDEHVVLEVAAIDLTTKETLHFVPRPRRLCWRDELDPTAMKINRYFERGTWEYELDEDDTQHAWEALNAMLDGNLIAGANPWFDAAHLAAEMVHHDLEPSWSYRHRDLATYAAGVLGLPPGSPRSTSNILRRLGITNSEPHSALPDAAAEAEAFLSLMKTAGVLP